MQAYSQARMTPVTTRPPSVHASKPRRVRTLLAVRGNYLDPVAVSLEVRKRRFADFVRRAVEHAKLTRGWTVPVIAKRAKIGYNTIYRWMDAEGDKTPLPDQVVAFCDALDIAPSAAFAILWPGKDDELPKVEPMPMDPRIVTLARRMQDPKATPLQKAVLLNSIDIILGISAAAAEADLSAEADSERDEGSAAG